MANIHPSSSLSFLFHSSKTTSQTEQKSVIHTSSGGYSTVTNKNKMHNLNELKKMATKKRNPRNRGARYHMEVNFGSDEEMQAFKARLKRVRKLVSPGDGGEVDNVGLLGAMMDVVESKSSTRDQRSSSSTEVAAGVAMQSFLRNSGIYTGDSNPEDKQLLDLLTTLSTPCPCGVTGSRWTVESIIQVGTYTNMFADFTITFVQKGHVVRVLFVCRRCHQQKGRGLAHGYFQATTSSTKSRVALYSAHEHSYKT